MRQKTIEKIKREINGWIVDLIEAYIRMNSSKIDTIIKEYIDKNYVICETSKALIRKEDAIKGKKEIKTVRKYGGSSDLFCPKTEDIIYTPFYSPSFVPKVEVEASPTGSENFWFSPFTAGTLTDSVTNECNKPKTKTKKKKKSKKK